MVGSYNNYKEVNCFVLFLCVCLSFYSDLEHLGEKLLELLLGDVVAARVDHVDDLL